MGKERFPRRWKKGNGDGSGKICGVLKKKDGCFSGKVDRPGEKGKPLEKTRDICQTEEMASFLKERSREVNNFYFFAVSGKEHPESR